ncbi:MAG: dynamin family protein [Candidatus Acidiferrales bacterium]
MNAEKKTSDAERQVDAIHSDRPEEKPQARLRDYEAIKFELAGLIREASSAAWITKQEALQRDFQDLLKRLAEDRFYLTFAGQFSRGKTTLMNAMLGMDRLPTGALPVTSVIIAVSYNTRERVVMRFQDSNLSREVPLSELIEWVTEQGNPGNRRKIEMAEVQVPAELLCRGAFFVDTPGLGSAVMENTETTHRFLPHIDALVLVTSFDVPLSQEEILFLRRARELHRKVFVVINKLDVCAPRQRDEVLHFIRQRLAAETPLDEIPLFPISASEALAAKLEGNPARLENSGLPVFERLLVSYLITDKSHDFLGATFDRIESLLAFRGVPGLKELGDRLQEIRDRVRGDKPSEDRVRHGQPSARESSAPQSLRISRCFVCEHMADETFKFMSRFQYELSHSREKQLFHAARSGFCALHSREYARLASPQGIASGYPNTLLLVAERLRSLLCADRLCDGWKDQFEKLLPSRDKCQACEVVAEYERETVDRFVREYQEAGRKSDFEVPCVCLRHLRGMMEAIPEGGLAMLMVLQSVAALERTAENLERYALRHGGLHMELVTKEELESPEKGLNLLVGQPNVRPSRCKLKHERKTQ